MKILLVAWFCLTAFVAAGAEGEPPTLLQSYIGIWKGNWLEGMSSGKIQLDIKESGGEIAFTALPAFGTQAAVISKMAGAEQRLSFQTSGADGRVMRFDLKPNAEFNKLKGKAYYESLHMELELVRAK